MKGKKEKAARIFQATGFAQLVLAARQAALQELPILAYHRVYDDWQDETFDFDPELVSATREEFAWQMRHVKSRFTPISFFDVSEFLEFGKPLPKRPIIVTFDDGYEDNFTHAFPILRDLGMPATIFLATGYLGGQATFWYDWLYHLCRHASRQGTRVEFGGRDVRFPNDFAGFYDRYVDLISFAKRMPDPAMRAEIAKLEHTLGINSPAHGFAASRPLTWEQVREMAANGIEFGSHTVTHPVLSNLTGDTLAGELSTSKVDIERQIDRKVTTIAYPVGEEYAFNEEVLQAVAKAGYSIGVTYVSGTNRMKHLDRFLLKRLRVERYTTRADFQTALAFPGW